MIKSSKSFVEPFSPYILLYNRFRIIVTDCLLLFIMVAISVAGTSIFTRQQTFNSTSEILGNNEFSCFENRGNVRSIKNINCSQSDSVALIPPSVWNLRNISDFLSCSVNSSLSLFSYSILRFSMSTLSFSIDRRSSSSTDICLSANLSSSSLIY